MPRIARHLLLLTASVMVTAAQADLSDPPQHGVGSVVFTPAARPPLANLAPRPSDAPDARDSRRYGIGYDARHGVDDDGARQRNRRMDGVESFPSYPSGGGAGASTGAGAGAGAGNGAGAGRGGRGR